MGYNTEAPRVEYEAGAAQTVFSFLFKVFLETDIVVYQTPVGETADDTTDILTLNVDYTVTITGDTGGSITLISGATSGDLVTILRELPTERDTDYQTNGDLLADTLDDDQNYQTYLIADSKEQENRFLTLPESAQGVSTTLPPPVPLSFMQWNAAGTALTFVNSLEADGYLWTAADIYTKTETDSALALKANLTGATFTGQVKGIAPVSAEDLTRKDYVDTKAPLASPALTGTPTAPTPATTDDSTKLATTAFARNNDLGVDQTWQGFTVGSTRDFGTLYTNTTGKPIYVVANTLTNTTNYTSLKAFVDGFQISTDNNNVDNWLNSVGVLVPNNSTYQITISGTNDTYKWYELR